MADLFSGFLDFRSLTSNSNLHLFLPSKHYCSSAIVHSHNSRINGMKRRPLHLTLLSKLSSPTPSSPDFDVISTHEHSDGSLIFRFGHPSEVAKTVKMEESNTVKEEIKREGEDGYSVVKVLDGDHQTEGMINKADREVTGTDLTKVADHTNSMVISSKSITVDEAENDSCKKLSEGSNDIELPTLISSKEMEVSSTPDVDIEHTGNVEEGPNEEHEDSSATDTSVLDRSSEMENDITTVELSEKETTDVTTSVSLMPDPVVAVPDNDVFQASLETVVTTDGSADSEYQNIETEMQNEIIEDGRERVGSDLVSPPSQSEPAISLSEENEDQNLQAGMQNLIVGNGNGSDMNDTQVKSPPKEASMNWSTGAEAQASGAGTGMLNEIVEYGSESEMISLRTLSPQLEAEPMLDEETGTDNVEEFREEDGTESLKRGDLVEAPVHEVTELKSTESATKSQEILMTDFVLSSSAALLPHPSKVERMRISLLVKHG